MIARANLIPDPRNHPDNANLPLTNQPQTLWGCTIAFLSLAVIAVLLRTWIRVKDRLWGWDDAFVVLACMASIIGDTMVCLMPNDGLGLHLWTLDEVHRTSYFKHIFATNIAYCTSSTLIKLSILYQYLRLFSETAASTFDVRYLVARRLTWSLIVICGIWGMIFSGLAAFSCTPIVKNWDWQTPGRCIGWGSKIPSHFFAMFLGHSISNSVLDFLVLLLPLPFLNILRLGGKSKAGLICLYTLGFAVGVVAVGRMIALSINRAGTIPVMDMTYYTPAVYIFGVLEVNLAIIAASIPTFWPALAAFATNKIFVVNEVQIHVESVPRDSFASGSAIVSDGKDAFEPRYLNDTSGLSRSISTSKAPSVQETRHGRSSPIGRTIAFDLGRRSSQESHRNLYRTGSGGEARRSASLTGNEEEDWFKELDKINNGKSTTTIERTAIPLEQIKALDRR